MSNSTEKWLVKVKRFKFETILRICDTRDEAEATAQSLNDAYQCKDYYVELFDRSRDPLF